jgi:hypothetical protein
MLKGLSAWIAGAALAFSLVAPAIVSANREGEVRYYPSGQTIRYYPSAEAQVPCDEPMDVSEADVNYVPTGTGHYTPTVEAVTVSAEPGMMMIAGDRIYYISDNPRYDLSGSNESIYLVTDGTTYRAPSGRTATFAAAGGMHHQVVAVPAEYRQDWLAVAAGDRPVRCIPAVGAVAPGAAVMPSSQVTEVSDDSDNGARYVDTGTRYVKGTRTRTVTHARKSRYSGANGYFVRREIPGETVAYERVEAPSYTTATMTAEGTPMGDLYQIGNSWYMEKDGEWSRSDSWRGPFFPVKKGHVPREVRESAERDHSFEE